MLTEIANQLDQTAASHADCCAARATLQADSGLSVGALALAKTNDSASAHLPACAIVGDQLSQQISAHEKQDSSRSYLARASDLFFKQDKADLKKLVRDQAEINKEAKAGQTIDPQQIQRVEKDIADDKHAVKVKNTVTGVVGSVATIAPFFVPGPVGFAIGTAANALDEANPNDSASLQAGEFALGGAKGVIKKWATGAISELPVSTAGSGILQGASSRIADTVMNHNTYVNSETGKVDLHQASSTLSDKVVNQSLNPITMATDSVARAGGDALAKSVGAAVDNVAGQMLSREVGDAAGKVISGYATDAARGAAGGFANGAIHEAYNELNEGKFSPAEIVSNGTKLGGEVAAASVVGGGVKQTVS